MNKDNFSFAFRDSKMWWLTFSIGLVGYLFAKEIPPTQWAYHEWLEFLMALLMALSGKAQTSWLPSKREAEIKKEAQFRKDQGRP